MMRKIPLITIILFSVLALSPKAYSCLPSFDKTTDTSSSAFFAVFDLRDRESFVQITNKDSVQGKTIHVQIFDVNNDCTENNFFDTLTPNDTHVYNLRDIQTNNGNPSGVVMPDNSYGIVVIVNVNPEGTEQVSTDDLISNFRILDESGYEYRTNSQGLGGFFADPPFLTFNFNNEAGVTLSDVIGISFILSGIDAEAQVSDVADIYTVMDVNILNLDEVVFSCRDIVFSCVDDDHPRLEELLENTGVSVASFEYGINEAIPHSRGGVLLCPGNNIANGIVQLIPIMQPQFSGYIGLNNGNGRGSMDSFWIGVQTGGGDG